MGFTSSRHEGTIRTQKKGVKFFFKFFFRRVWALGCGGVGVGVEVWRCGAAGYGWGGLDEGGIGICLGGGSLDGTPNRAPRVSPSRNRIAGSCVIDRPTFRIPGSHICAWDVGLFPPASEVTLHSPQDGRNASRRS